MNKYIEMKQAQLLLNILLGFGVGIFVFGMFLIISNSVIEESQEPLQTPLYLKQMSCSQLEDVLETGSPEAERNIYISNLMILKGCRL